ncbi:hypothetical protein [Methylotuvimicrobium buryatense]|uniref:Uncharacterized protein n=1 Tax=Methylotuvimicrobium buryatense TaxID=95641 RepID=A0A4V1IK66_METBY|nr:hypothetical protein [Methylotuvimicrobium buryatense]QCW83835.1 hypothetical protein EQU24_17485 [Methylotuvimicrobium buryatense]
MTEGEGLSAFFVLLLLIIAGLFFGYAVYGYFSAAKKIRFYKDLLANVDQNELAGKQRDIRNKALEHQPGDNITPARKILCSAELKDKSLRAVNLFWMLAPSW